MGSEKGDDGNAADALRGSYCGTPCVMGAAAGKATAVTCPGATDDNSGTAEDIPGMPGAPADGMDGTEGSGMPNWGNLVSKADPA
jgi:hypothetical protein